MIATLPMYDRPETAAANDRFWELIRSHLAQAPDTLTRGDFHWLAPNLVLSQTCSLPYRSALQGGVTIVATPVHNLPCPAGTYFSVVVTRKDDDRSELGEFRDARLVINSPLSQSGWASIDEMANDAGFRFTSVLESGSHEESAKRVASGHADICAIDAVSWEMIKKWDSAAEKLKVIAETPPTPALPYITAMDRDPAPIQEALVSAVHELSPDDQEALCLIDMTYVPADHYITMSIPPAPITAPFSL